MAATRGRPKKAPVVTIRCGNCNKELNEGNFYISYSKFFKRSPLCKNCIESMFKHYCRKYKDEGHDAPEKDALRRMCMSMDIYYSEERYQNAVENSKSKDSNFTLLSSFFKISGLSQFNGKTYDNTIDEERSLMFEEAIDTNRTYEASESTRKFFGNGLPDEDYEFLQEQYDDWTARHECNTKAQEEIFKQICFVQLELLKATRMKEDTKDLTATFQKLLDSAKLQPKQNSSETTSDSQTFGTLIDKWENTRPIPEPEDSFKDVDNIGRYINIFFKGHLAKMMGIKNGLSNTYNEFMKKYTVEKPEYEGEEGSEALFDAIFGDQQLDGGD